MTATLTLAGILAVVLIAWLWREFANQDRRMSGIEARLTAAEQEAARRAALLAQADLRRPRNRNCVNDAVESAALQLIETRMGLDAESARVETALAYLRAIRSPQK
jgi:hypothetical protein